MNPNALLALLASLFDQLGAAQAEIAALKVELAVAKERPEIGEQSK